MDLGTNTVVATIPLGIQPSGIAITPDGCSAYVSNYSTIYNGAGFTDLTASQGTVNVIDVHSNTLKSPIIGVGLSPDTIAISPNGQFAYVSNYTSNTVSVIALPSPLYDINRLRPIYNLQRDKTRLKLKKAGIK